MTDLHRVVPVGFMLSVAFLLLLTASPSWAELNCGATIFPGEEVTLNKDLNCDGESPALTVIGPKAVLNLGGHTVNCDDPLNATGIQLEDLGAILQFGTVTNCRFAVDVAGTGHHLVTKVTATNSNGGFRVFSDENVLSYNRSKNNGRGYTVPTTGTRNTLKANLAENNNGLGFSIGINTDSNILTKNLAIGSNNSPGFQIAGNRHKVSQNLSANNTGPGGNGFNFLGDDMKVLSNKAISNAGSGFFFQSGSGHFVLGNIALKNQVHGIEFDSGAINSKIRVNIAKRNEGVDLFDDNFPDCDNNSWKFNFFTSRNQPCIR